MVHKSHSSTSPALYCYPAFWVETRSNLGCITFEVTTPKLQKMSWFVFSSSMLHTEKRRVSDSTTVFNSNAPACALTRTTSQEKLIMKTPHYPIFRCSVRCVPENKKQTALITPPPFPKWLQLLNPILLCSSGRLLERFTLKEWL